MAESEALALASASVSAASVSATETVFLLVAEDGQKVKIDRKSAQQIGILQAMLQMGSGAITFPVPAVKSTILLKVVEFLEQHRDDLPLRPTLPSRSKNQPAELQSGFGNDDDGDDDDDVERDEISGVGDLRIDSRPASSDSSDDEYVYEEYLASVTPWDQKFLDSLDLPTLIELTKAANYLNIPSLLDLCCRTIAKQMTGLKADELRKKFNLPNDFTPEEEAKMAAEFAWIEE